MNYHNITKDDMRNGDGLRVVLWVAGCEHHCKNCQNPVTWDPNDGLFFDTTAVLEVLSQLDKDYIEGITFSGGDPLHPANIGDVTIFSRSLKESYPGKTIWLYTGYLYEDISDLPVMKYIDVLVDGPFVEQLKDNNLKWRGSSNQRVIDIQKTRKTGNIVLWCD